MKQIKNSIIKKSNVFIRFFLSFLGLGTACHFLACAYGTPYATYKLKGSVHSETTSSPITNIQVTLDNYYFTYTDETGHFEISTTDSPNASDFLLEFKDIDGKINAEYHSLDTIIKFVDPKFSGESDNWNVGSTEKEVHIKLKEKPLKNNK